MSINNGHTPLPNSFLTTINKLGLTHREYRLMIIIGTEIYRFPEGRETLSKELATRYLESLTKIKQNHISRMLNKFHSRGYIKYIKSHIKGQGSIIILTLDTAAGSNNSDTATVSNSMKLDTPTVSNQVKLDTATVSNPINLSIKDHQELDLTDSNINIDQKENHPERKDIETSLNSSFSIEDKLINSKKSNLNMPAMNVLCPAGGEAGKSEFTDLGSVLANFIPASTPSTPSAAPIVNKLGPSGSALTPSVIEEGHKVLSSKGFNKEQVQSITQRITNSIRKHNPKRPDCYFMAAVNNEKVKTAHMTVNYPDSAQGASPIIHPDPVTYPQLKVNKQEEVKQESPEVVLNKIQSLKPAELWQIIGEVNNDMKVQKSLAFFESDEMKKHILINHYITEFKKRYPGVYLT